MLRIRLTRRAIYTLGLVAVLAVLIGSYSLYRTRSTPEIRTIPITDLLNRAERGELHRVVVNGPLVSAVDAAGTQYRAVKEEHVAVSEILRQRGVDVAVDTGTTDISPGLVMGLVPIIAILVLFFLTARRTGAGNPTLSFGKSGARLSPTNRPTVTFDDVAGVEEAKGELREIVEFLKHPERFTALGARIPKGVLLVGPPGTGKTLISKAVAGEAGVPFFSISGSEFVEMFVGVGASRVRDLFRNAKKNAPCIICVDEIDAVGRQRGVSVGGGNEEREQTLNQLLVEMDGFDSNTNIIVLAATNRPDVLDPALLRPGRFDRRVTLDAPDVAGRKAILNVHAKSKAFAEGVELDVLARQTVGFSGADLANVMNEAALLAGRFGRDGITREDLDEAMMRVVAGPERRSRVISDYQKRIVAFHEVGHALVARMLEHADPVHKVSVIARGPALGVTVYAPKEDSYLVSREQLLARMAHALGGRMAEELVFGDVTTGAKADIESVTNIARRMVCEFGMSDLGVIVLTRRDDGTALLVSDELSSKIDQACNRLVAEACEKARRILIERRDALDAISERLLEVETIDGDELDRLIERSEQRSFEDQVKELIGA
ncbi:MAG TPA: ATP-dependent zinc metalloprotease FtsH [Chloroflexota bacterium]